MNWKIDYTDKAKKDLNDFKGYSRNQIMKAIQKVSTNPLPQNEGGYGKPLGNHAKTKLTGFLKIKLLKLGIRVIYKLERIEEIMTVVVISIRDDSKCYEETHKRIKRG